MAEFWEDLFFFASLLCKLLLIGKYIDITGNFWHKSESSTFGHAVQKPVGLWVHAIDCINNEVNLWRRSTEQWNHTNRYLICTCRAATNAKVGALAPFFQPAKKRKKKKKKIFNFFFKNPQKTPPSWGILIENKAVIHISYKHCEASLASQCSIKVIQWHFRFLCLVSYLQVFKPCMPP